MAIALDADRNAYVTGFTLSSDFPTVNPVQPSPVGGLRDKTVFVAKLDASGSALAYSTFLGGSVLDVGTAYAEASIGWGIAVDAGRNAWVAGWTQARDFPTTAGAFQTTLGGVPDGHGDLDAFVVRLDPTGSILRYASFIGGRGQDVAIGIALDPAGNAYLTGGTSLRRTDTGLVVAPPHFPTTAGAFQPVFNGGSHDAFVVKLADPGLALQFVVFPPQFPSLPPAGTVGVPYVGNVGIGGGVPRAGPEGYLVERIQGALPAGLKLGSGNILSGTPLQIQTALFRVQVSDQTAVIADQADRSITIQAATTPVPADGAAGVSPAQPVAWPVIGSAPSYRIMIATSAGALPTAAGAETCPGCVVNAVVASPVFVPVVGTFQPGTTYFWQVRATNGGAWSAVRSFTTRAALVAFSDHPLVAGTTPVRAQHVQELRTAINALRAQLEMAAFDFGPAVAPGHPVQALHLSGLRAALAEVFAAVGRPLPLAEPAITARVTPIRASHLTELRMAVDFLE
jgi:hypothetical protein